MPALRTPRARTVLVDPALPPPGSVPPTFGAGLVVSGTVVSVDFGTTAGRVAPGEKLPAVIPIDTGGALLHQVLRFDGAAFKPAGLPAPPDPADFGPARVALFDYATAAMAAPEVVGLRALDPADHAVSGRTTTLVLEAVGRVTAPGLEATLELLDEADALVASLSWTETERTRKTSAVTLPEGAEIYRARVRCGGVVTPETQYAQFGGAGLLVNWS